MFINKQENFSVTGKCSSRPTLWSKNVFFLGVCWADIWLEVTQFLPQGTLNKKFGFLDYLEQDCAPRNILEPRLEPNLPTLFNDLRMGIDAFS